MSVKIRLQRHGKKGKPFYWIVAADARAKRDGRYLEKIGTYNPNVNPAVIDLNVDKAVEWLQNGAQPTDTAKNILSYKGAMLKNHLVEEKAAKIADKEAGLSKAESEAKAKALAAEKAVNEARIEAAKPVVEEVAEEASEEVEAAAETIDEAQEKAAE
ncbi:UNVERIFIED_CONTAM: hypothetical protein GTU68_054896 [Idotea baltica]|nr:hypothetical protein [Idotea baltica]